MVVSKRADFVVPLDVSRCASHRRREGVEWAAGELELENLTPRSSRNARQGARMCQHIRQSLADLQEEDRHRAV